MPTPFDADLSPGAPVFAATQRAGANFTDLCVARRQETPGIRRSLLLDLEKISSQRHPPPYVDTTYIQRLRRR